MSLKSACFTDAAIFWQIAKLPFLRLHPQVPDPQDLRTTGRLIERILLYTRLT